MRRRYILAALIGTIVGFAILPIYTYASWIFAPKGLEPAWHRKFLEQTEPGRIAWYNSQPEWYRHGTVLKQQPYKPLEQEQRIIDQAFDIAVKQGCLDNCWLVPVMTALGALGLGSWDRFKKNKSNSTVS